MNGERRAEILSKDRLSVADIQELFGIGYQGAAKIIRDIKRSFKFTGRNLRLDMRGYIHTQDYLEHFGMDKKEVQ